MSRSRRSREINSRPRVEWLEETSGQHTRRHAGYRGKAAEIFAAQTLGAPPAANQNQPPVRKPHSLGDWYAVSIRMVMGLLAIAAIIAVMLIGLMVWLVVVNAALIVLAIFAIWCAVAVRKRFAR